MEKFKPDANAFIWEIKMQLGSFIENSKSIDRKTKDSLIKEMNTNWIDDRFDGTKFVEAAVGYATHSWKHQNFKLAELWKEVAVNNAKVNNEPHKVADATVKRFAEEFNLDTAYYKFDKED